MYKIVFEDNTEFNGGVPKDSKWNEMPNKKIKILLYNLKDRILSLEGYREYNHIVEKCTGVGNKIDMVSKILLMGKVDDVVHIITIDFVKGKLLKNITPIGKEYNNKPIISGWKKGLKSSHPKVQTLSP